MSESSEADPSAQERALLRYYYYIHHGIETGQVAPMADSWLHRMDAMLTNKLRVMWGEWHTERQWERDCSKSDNSKFALRQKRYPYHSHAIPGVKHDNGKQMSPLIIFIRSASG